jgi:hypothetical protein
MRLELAQACMGMLETMLLEMILDDSLGMSFSSRKCLSKYDIK